MKLFVGETGELTAENEDYNIESQPNAKPDSSKEQAKRHNKNLDRLVKIPKIVVPLCLKILEMDKEMI